jgi:hypothetical protein
MLVVLERLTPVEPVPEIVFPVISTLSPPPMPIPLPTIWLLVIAELVVEKIRIARPPLMWPVNLFSLMETLSIPMSP